jgi:hypothetical protein
MTFILPKTLSFNIYYLNQNHVSFEAFTAVLIQVEFWVVTLCSDKVGYQRFRGPCCLHIQSEVRGSIDL